MAIKNDIPSIVNLDSVILPHNIEAEQAVLGNMIASAEALHRLSTFLNKDCFFKEEHALIFSTIMTLFKKNQGVDQISIIDHLRSTRNLEKAGGFQYIVELTNQIKTSDYFTYAAIVADKAMKRIAMTVYLNGINRIAAGQEDTLSVIKESENAISHAYTFLADAKDTSAANIGERVAKQVLANYHAETYLTGVPYGLERLDRATGGAQPGQVITVVARTRQGKSAVAAAFMYNASLFKNPDGSAKYPYDFFSMEMQDTEVFIRLVSIELFRRDIYIPYSDIMKGKLTDHLMIQVQSAIAAVMERGIYIDDEPALNHLMLSNKIANSIRKRGTKGVVVDYVQLMDSVGDSGPAAEKIRDNMKQLKTMAKLYNVPIIALVQADRATEKSLRKPPGLADGAGSSGIENSSDVFISLFREDLFYTGEDPSVETRKGQILISLLKQKQGGLCNDWYHFDAAINCFTDINYEAMLRGDYLKKEKMWQGFDEAEDFVYNKENYERYDGWA